MGGFEGGIGEVGGSTGGVGEVGGVGGFEGGGVCIGVLVELGPFGPFVPIFLVTNQTNKIRATTAIIIQKSVIIIKNLNRLFSTLK